jgi:hypothetical protein
MWRSLLQKWWRPVVGLILGLATAATAAKLVPVTTLPREGITATLVQLGLGDPTKALDVIDWIIVQNWYYLLPILLGAIVTVAIMADSEFKPSIKSGMRMAAISVFPVPFLMIMMALTKGFSYDLFTWAERLIMIPGAAVTMGVLGGVIATYGIRIGLGFKRRTKSIL